MHAVCGWLVRLGGLQCIAWTGHGKIEWLITTTRLAARLPGSGQLAITWWRDLMDPQPRRIRGLIPGA
ncbi:MAG TPA: hypothetical protein VE733_14525 [Streptosporangiaceae bacterium]|nr:hypothetical protein [Streptosporangiaceae bacterium]